MEHVGRWRGGWEGHPLPLGRTTLLFQAVTRRGAETGEGKLGLLLGFSIKFYLFLPSPWLDNHSVKYYIFKRLDSSLVLRGFDTHSPEGNELGQIVSPSSFQLPSAVDS